MTLRKQTIALIAAVSLVATAAARAEEPAAPSDNTTVHLDPGTLVAELRAFSGSKVYPAQAVTCEHPCILSAAPRSVLEISGEGIHHTTLELDPSVTRLDLKLQAAPGWKRPTAVGLFLTSAMLATFEVIVLPVMVNDHVLAGPVEKPGQFAAIATGTLVTAAASYVAGTILYKSSNEAEVVR
ncbi:MAG: hypothetical protein JST92_25565 [Deltaproteobacteria bacterium]|nr:hypothetical protein [Deltaproteobacteria bacterium]